MFIRWLTEYVMVQNWVVVLWLFGLAVMTAVVIRQVVSDKAGEK